jgi:hypothetical protein
MKEISRLAEVIRKKTYVVYVEQHNPRMHIPYQDVSMVAFRQHVY